MQLQVAHQPRINSHQLFQVVAHVYKDTCTVKKVLLRHMLDLCMPACNPAPACLPCTSSLLRDHVVSSRCVHWFHALTDKFPVSCHSYAW